MDPGEPGTEVLATNLAQELQQLRFVLSELKAQSNWRQSRETLAQFQFNLDPGEAGTESLVLFGEQQVFQLRTMLRELKGGSPWYQSAETLTSFRLGTDPGEVNSEVLPLFGEQQLNQIRFAIREMKGTVQWYETNATRIAPLGQTTYAVAGWADGVNTNYQWVIPAPLGMDFSRNSTVKMYLTNSVAGGNVQFSYQAVLIRDGQPLYGIGFTAAPWSPALANTSYLRFFEFGPNIFQGNDVIVFQLNRQGTDNVNDTNTGVVGALGGWFEYIGVASR
jgi:hypothetical protein